MRYSLSGSTGLTWSEIRDAAQLGEQLGFDSFFAADHLMAVAGFDEDAGLLDAVSLLLALAPVTTTLRLGAMVSPITIRHPVVLARAMQTLDLISEGRAEVGVGAGWSQSEHEIFGLPFPPASRRLELLEDACRTLVSLWEDPDPVHKEGDFPLRGARLRPRPVQRLNPASRGRCVRSRGPHRRPLGPGLECDRFPGLLGGAGGAPPRGGARELRGRERWRSRPPCGWSSVKPSRRGRPRRTQCAPPLGLVTRSGRSFLAGEDPVAALVHRPTRGTLRLHGVVGARRRRTRTDLDTSSVGP